MRKNWGKLFVLFLTTAAISGIVTAPVSAKAAENQAEIVEEVVEIEEEKEDSEEKAEKDKKKEKAEKKEVNYKEKTITITKTGFVADSFNGVDAIYRPGGNDGSSATYSCAAFIKKYYKKMYDVSVYNLFGGNTPKTYEGEKITSVKSPKAGDIAYKNGHWAIVKKVNDNDTVTLIEQNWKWGGNQCKVNRTVDTTSLKYFRLAK